MSGPIHQAIDALERAEMAFRDNDLVTAKECRVCRRIIKGGSHTSDCPFDGLKHAARRLKDFLREVQS